MQEQASQDRPEPWPDGRPKHIPQGTEVIEHPPRFFVISESKTLSLLLWIGMGLFCAYFGYNPDFVPSPPFRHWPSALGILGAYVAITLALRETIVLHMKHQHQKDAPLAWSRKFLLFGWICFLGLGTGLFSVPVIILALALVVVGLAGYLLRWLKRLDQPDRPLPTLHIKPTYAFVQPAAALILGILLIPLAFLVIEYGIWLIILAPLLALACLGLWAWLERSAISSSTRWWAGAMVLALLPFFTTGLAYNKQLPGFHLGFQPALISAIKFAPQWSPKQKVRLLLDSTFPNHQQQARRLYLTQIWLRGDVPASKVEDALKLFSSQWAQDLEHHPTLQRPIIHKAIARLNQKRRINGGSPYTNKVAHVIGHLYQRLPKQRNAIQVALVQQLIAPIGCKTKKMPCRNAEVYLRAWLRDVLSASDKKRLKVHLLFPSNDLLWETWRKLPGADPNRQMIYLLHQLDKQSTKSNDAPSAFARIFLFYLLDEDPYYLYKIKSKEVRQALTKLLSRLIQEDLRSSMQERQMTGMLLFGEACYLQGKRLGLSLCNRLVRHFQRPAWKALQAQAKSRKAQRVVTAIASPSLTTDDHLARSQALLKLSLKALKIQQQIRVIFNKPLPKEPQAKEQEKQRQLNKAKALSKELEAIKLQKQVIKKTYRVEKPFAHLRRSKPTSKPTSRPAP